MKQKIAAHVLSFVEASIEEEVIKSIQIVSKDYSFDESYKMKNFLGMKVDRRAFQSEETKVNSKNTYRWHLIQWIWNAEFKKESKEDIVV